MTGAGDFSKIESLRERVLIGNHMKRANPLRVLLKNLDKPQCFLEAKLLSEHLSNSQSRELISSKFASAIDRPAEEQRISVLESWYLRAVQPTPSFESGR